MSLDNRPGIYPINKRTGERIERQRMYASSAITPDEYPGDVTYHKPLGQPTMESHVFVPLSIALVLAIVALVGGAAIAYYLEIGPAFPLVGALVVFTMSFLWRVGAGDRLLWLIEEYTGLDIDGDGEIGIAPRDIPVNASGRTNMLNMSPKEEGLKPSQWAEVAIAILNKQGNVSRRGINGNSKLSQSLATQAANILHDGKRAENGELNAAGWDWLVSYLPAHTQCLMERPTPPTEPPHPYIPGLPDGWQPPNQPASQPAG